MCDCTNTRQYKYCQLLLWLTLNLPNLCISVYTCTYHPPMPPARTRHDAGHLPNICLSASANATTCSVSWEFATLNDEFLCCHAIWCQLLCYQSPFYTMFEAWIMRNTPCCCGGAYPTLPLSDVGHSASHAYEFHTRTAVAMLPVVVRQTTCAEDGVMCDRQSRKTETTWLSHLLRVT